MRQRLVQLLVLLGIVIGMVWATPAPLVAATDRTHELATPQVATATNLKFPWSGGEEWKLTQGWHFLPKELAALNYAVDFAPLSQNHDILAAHTGVVLIICDGPKSQSLLLTADDGFQTAYVHIKKGTLKVVDGERIAQGTVLGSTVDNLPPNTKDSDKCGEWTGAHVHMEFSSREVTIDGWTSNSMNIWYSGALEKTVNSNFLSTNIAVSSSLKGYIDGPAPNAQLSNRIKINGWAKSTNSTIKEVNIYGRLAGSNHGFVPLAKANYGEYRPDPGLAGPYGWSWEWDTSRYGNGNYELKVKATSLDDSSAWLLDSANHSEILSVNVQNSTHVCLKPLYRYFNGSVLRHFYTQHWSELGLGDVNWRYEQITGFVAASGCSLPSGTPLYRLAHNTLTPKHMYATQYERDVLVSSGLYHDEGSVGLIAQQAQSQYVMASLQRMYHAGRNDHFFTTDQNEVNLARNEGYQLENSVGQIVTVANVIPNPPTGLSPSGTTLNSLNVQLTWNDGGDPDNYPRNNRDYVVEVRATNNSWSQSRSWNTNTNWLVTVPQPGTYVWKVRSGDGLSPSAWSAERQFTVSTNAQAGLMVNPNPIPASTSSSSATITWGTGNGTQGQLFVSENGGPDRLMAQGDYGVDSPAWFAPGSEYRFRLYAGLNRETLLREITVRRERSLIANPSSIPAGAQGLQQIMLYWSTGDGSEAQVYVSKDGEPEKLMAQGPYGKANPAWIVPGSVYRFRLYAGFNRATLLREIIVR
ncbi:peptidoglycan DD-metalloendopeptidase family protein [Herpetosiphon gulosus]|uniref:Peptidase M23 domain-containing protein n=1 Tax=Herpetosiphon gulosus TaxID=1973496 RepID=A0ABP9X0J0_9CHLR